MSKYISLENLERYDAKMQERAASFCASKEDGMWRQTEKAGAVSFWPVGNSPLEGTVEFMFKETGPASGEKSPSNPSTITGVSSVKVTRCGKNLIWTPWQDATTVTRDGITWTVNGDGTVTASGTATADSYFNVRTSTAGNRQLLDSGLTYVLSGCPASGSNSTYLLAFVCNSATFKDFGAGTTCSVNADDSGWISCIVRSGVTVSNLTFKPQLELGTVATTFEPYSGADYTVNLGNTYYGGSIDLATGLMTVKSQKVMIDENCSYTLLTGETNNDMVALVVEMPDILSSSELKLFRSTSSCDSLPLIQYQNITNSDECIMFGGEWQVVRYKQIRVYMLRSTLGVSSSATATEVQNAAKTWFTSHPATFIAGYEEPYWTTVQLTPTQILSLAQTDKYTPRLNTVYSDAENVQIVYQKNPVRDKFEKVQAIIAQGGNV